MRAEGPVLLEAITYRYAGHSMGDPERYRSKAEIEEWKQRGPIHSLSAQLKAEGRLDEEAFLALDAEAEAEVAAAVAFAEQAPWEPVADLLKDVHTPAGAAALGAPVVGVLPRRPGLSRSQAVRRLRDALFR